MRASLTTLVCIAATTVLASSAFAQVAFPLPPWPGIPAAPPIAPTTTAKVTSTKSTGDLRLSAGVGVDASGSLVVSMAAIKHPDLPNLPVNPLFANVSVSAHVAGSLALACTIKGVSSSARAPVDLVFVNDTTGSMSGTVHGISDSIKSFAQKIHAGGVDARFSMYTYGDAFATRPGPSKFSVGGGDFDPPSFDTIPRPYLGLSDLAPFETFLAELRKSGALGDGGGDSAENTLGALRYAHRTASFRQGAARVFVVIADNPAHQTASVGSKFGPTFAPPSGDEVVEELQGTAVAHVVGKDKGAAPYYNVKKLADGTGGGFRDLPTNGKVDLSTLGLDAYLLSGYRGSCTGLAVGSLDLEIKATVIGKKVYTGSLAFKVVVK